MTAILAIETATDACSVALYRDGHYSQRHEVLPRQHNQRLFSMLGELLPAGSLRDQGIDALAYGCGPGSFTGLRIAASAVQGLAFASNLPALPVSTLACQVATALRQGSIDGRRRQATGAQYTGRAYKRSLLGNLPGNGRSTCSAGWPLRLCSLAVAA
jgi:tRNA threonylcarbamoyladenosine biosynthesis protein TsaB